MRFNLRIGNTVNVTITAYDKYGGETLRFNLRIGNTVNVTYYIYSVSSMLRMFQPKNRKYSQCDNLALEFDIRSLIEVST